jgi:hypothetical protein
MILTTNLAQKACFYDRNLSKNTITKKVVTDQKRISACGGKTRAQVVGEGPCGAAWWDRHG